jgi:hypothetical protein
MFVGIADFGICRFGISVPGDLGQFTVAALPMTAPIRVVWVIVAERGTHRAENTFYLKRTTTHNNSLSRRCIISQLLFNCISEDAMQLLTLEQLRATQEAGGVLTVTLRGEGAAFEVQVETRRGLAKLVKARKARTAPEIRRFADPRKALLLLRDLGISEAHIDSQQWRPEDQAFERTSRPDRAEHLRAAHQALSHTEWVQQKVDAARAGLVDGSNQRIAPDQWETIRAAKKRQRDSL